MNRQIRKAVSCARANPQVAYIAPTYSQAKRVAWGFFRHYTAPLEKAGLVKYWDTELRAEIDRGNDKATIYLLGAENPDSIRGMYLDDAVLDEYATMPHRIWGEIVRPALADRRGSALWIGTPKGHNHLYDVYTEAKRKMEENRNWYATLQKASESGVLDEEELSDLRGDMTEAQYRQELECDFLAALEGSYYGEDIAKAEREGRVCPVPYDTNGQVYTAWDLGMDDYMSIWFAQIVGGEIRLVDYYENQNEGLEHYVRYLKEKPYNYAEHLFPHDVRVRELSTGRSRFEALQEMGIEPTVVPKLDVEDGINAVRQILSRCWFDQSKTFYGVECLRQYCKRKDRLTGMFLPKAKHDKFSHGADAFRTLATGIPGFDPQRYERRRRYDYEPRSGGTWMSA